MRQVTELKTSLPIDFTDYVHFGGEHYFLSWNMIYIYNKDWEEINKIKISKLRYFCQLEVTSEYFFLMKRESSNSDTTISCTTLIVLLDRRGKHLWSYQLEGGKGESISLDGNIPRLVCSSYGKDIFVNKKKYKASMSIFDLKSGHLQKTVKIKEEENVKWPIVSTSVGREDVVLIMDDHLFFSLWYLDNSIEHVYLDDKVRERLFEKCYVYPFGSLGYNCGFVTLSYSNGSIAILSLNIEKRIIELVEEIETNKLSHGAFLIKSDMSEVCVMNMSETFIFGERNSLSYILG